MLFFCQVYAVPDNGKCSKMFDLSMLAEFGTILCSSTSICESVTESLINNDKDGHNRPVVLILGSYHKRGFVEILDPSSSKDPSAFDKCYWLVYFSVQGFLKTIKEEKESEFTKNIIEDTINRNSRGLKKKSRKKSIQTEIHFFQTFEIPDISYRRTIFFFSSPSPEFPSQVEDIVNKSSEHRIISYQDNVYHSLLYIPLITGAFSTQRSFQDPLLTPPQVCVEDVAIPDTLNCPQPFHDDCDHDSHLPDVTYPIPPLIYNIDLRTELLPFSPAPSPDIESGEDTVNRPQPVTRRHYFEDQVLIILENKGGHLLQGAHTAKSLPTFLRSPPGSPYLPRHDQDTVNTPETTPHLSLHHHISPPVYLPPGDDTQDKSSPRVNIKLLPPQQALYIELEDSYLLNSSLLKSVSSTNIMNSILFKRPTIPAHAGSSLAGHLSPPQSPVLPVRRESRREDLFDQVRRHSRGLNFYR